MIGLSISFKEHIDLNKEIVNATIIKKPGERYLDNKPTMIRYPLKLILHLTNMVI
jgi:hypothetical protein